MNRFDYVKYDAAATITQNHFKDAVSKLERDINGIGASTVNRTTPGNPTLASLARSKASALTKLEELYMWIGKAIRDEQIVRNGSAPLQEERKDG